MLRAHLVLTGSCEARESQASRAVSSQCGAESRERTAAANGETEREVLASS